jgi:hypothetical protein
LSVCGTGQRRNSLNNAKSMALAGAVKAFAFKSDCLGVAALEASSALDLDDGWRAVGNAANRNSGQVRALPPAPAPLRSCALADPGSPDSRA